MNKLLLPKQFLFICFLLIAGFTAKSQLINEGFEGAIFPPAGWVNVQTASNNALPVEWTQASAGSEVTDPGELQIDPHTGSGMAAFNSYDFGPVVGDAAYLASPPFSLAASGPQKVTFWMYRNENIYAEPDSVSVYINTAQNLTGASFLGKIIRLRSLAPAEAANGWYQYSFAIPTSFTGANNYIIFNAVSEYGENMFIDDVTVEDFAGCSGAPSAGIISAPSSVCANEQILFENTGATNASGMTYAWQSSPNSNGPWTDIPGQTNVDNATASQTSETYYRFFATCANSGLSDSSNVLLITITPQNLCYCKPPDIDLHTFINDYISNLTIQGTTLNSSNATNGSTGYTNVPPVPASNTADLSQVTNYLVNATIEDGGPLQVSCWIDFDQSGTFDANEFTDLTIVGTLASGTISIPADAIPGQTGLRIRARAAGFADTDACGSFGSGETEDYVVTIVTNTALNGALVDIIPPLASCNATNDVVVKLRNSGNVNIAANAATVALYITGANPQGPLTQTNPAELLPGDTATLTFTCSFPVNGGNLDSAVIQTLAGDINAADDFITTSHITLPAAVNAPYAEDFEGSVPGWTVSQIAGSGVWGLASDVSYPDYSPAYTLLPKSGSSVALFDSYNFTAGTISRASSNCITLPADANSACGYVAGFYFTQDAQYLTLQDSVVVSVSADGGTTYTRLGVVKRVDSTLSPTQPQAIYSTPEWRLYTFDVGQYAGSTVQFAFDAYGNFGNQMAIDSFFVGPKTTAGNIALAGGQETGASLFPAISQCTDADGWTYYSDGNSSRYLFGVQWDPSNTGANAAAKAQAVAKITVDRKWFAAENVPLQMATYTMQRYWDVDLNGAVMTGPVNVRFFYSQKELDSIILAKNNYVTATGGNDEGFWWFKTISPDEFIPSPSTVTYDNVLNSIILEDVNTTGALINGTLYAQFNDITSFSGGTAASGVGPGNPVPVGLLSFNAKRAARVNMLSWITTQEINTDRFIVERGADSRNFTAIGEVTAAGNSSGNINYSFIDHTPVRGVNFYRLKVVERNGNTKYSDVRSVRNEGTADIAVYPNPVKDMMMVNISSDKIDRAIITITDMNGKLLQVKNTAITEGSNYININTGAMAKGTYIVKIQLNDDMVVRKVNKL